MIALTRPNAFSQVRLRNFGLLELPNDLNGQPGGPAFEPFLTTSTFRSYGSVVVDFHGVWSGRKHDFGSWDELELFLALEANPRVIDIREQYPVVSQSVLDDLLEDRIVSRNRVFTFDFVLTLAPTTTSGTLRYRAGSYKPEQQIDTLRESRRRPREIEAARQMGWGWDYFARPPQQAVNNYRKLHEWAKGGDLDRSAAEARDLAHLLHKTTSVKPLRRLLEINGGRLGIAPARLFHVYATAFYLGYLRLDMRVAVDADLPPALVRSEHGR